MIKDIKEFIEQEMVDSSHISRDEMLIDIICNTGCYAEAFMDHTTYDNKGLSQTEMEAKIIEVARSMQ